MLVIPVIALILGIWHGAFALLQPLDMHLNTNATVLTVLAYIGSYNAMLPLTDAVVPILAINFALTSYLTSFRFVKFTVNLVRGSGAE